MKKFFCLLLAALLLLAAACAEAEDMRAFYNPEGYSLMRVTDAFLMEDGDHAVQVSFGEVDFSSEISATWIGFDEEKVFTLTVAPDAVIELPESLSAIEDNAPAAFEDLLAFVNAQIDAYDDVEFYCEFDMNEAGVLTRLIYCFLPW